ncbi:MAG: EAL domain-containing protein, partial [Gammaproteobacteria bacterium]|nr:EAL domain-containing protein [Gammaproteobacteria bacterium]
MSQSAHQLLLIDAKPEDARLIQSELAQSKYYLYKMDVAQNLAQGLERIKKGGIDVILMDLVLPDTQGIAAFLRIYPKAGNIPIIALVQQADEELGQLAVEKGALDYLIKQQIVSNLLIKALRYATDRTHTLMALKASEAKYRELFQNVTAGVFQTSLDGKFLSANPAMVRLLGYDTEEELLGLDIAKEVYMYPDSRDNWSRTILEKGEIRNSELVLRKRDGTKIVVLENAQAVRSHTGEVMYFQGALTDITEAHEQSKRLSYDASHDALTGLINRREFELRVERAMEDRKVDKTEHAVCYMDLDKFKVINDSCGHVAGDELLRQLGAVLHARVRQGDTIARLGGDEFGVLLNHCTRENAILVSKNLLRAIRDFKFAWNQRQFPVGASIGLVPIDDSFANVTDVLSAADAACYQAKDRGRNQLHLYEPKDQTQGHYSGEIQWASRVKKALTNDEFILDIQPIIPVKPSARGSRYLEILVRMRDENGRQIPPGAFLPTVERYNLMGQLDSWVLKHTLAELSKESANLGAIGRVFINLSADSLLDSHFALNLSTILKQSQVPATKLCFEVTEASAMTNLTKANATINAVRELGCRFALDDFGTGVSSFAYLKALNVDYLKIDGAHIRDLANDKSDYEIVRAITHVGHALGREVIAESVESKRVLSALQEIGVDFVQGYTLAPPRPIEQINMTVSVET